MAYIQPTAGGVVKTTGDGRYQFTEYPDGSSWSPDGRMLAAPRTPLQASDYHPAVGATITAAPQAPAYTPAPSTGKTSGIEVTSTGGEVYVAPAALQGLGLAKGTVVTATVDTLVITTPGKKTEVITLPNKNQVEALEAKIDDANKKVEALNLEVERFNASSAGTQAQADALNLEVERFNASSAGTQAQADALNLEVERFYASSAGTQAQADALQSKIDKLHEEIAPIYRVAELTNVLNTVTQHEVNTRSTTSQLQVAQKTPAGLAQSLWWGVTPWTEETGGTVKSYTKEKGYIGMIGGFNKNVGKVVLPGAGLAVLIAVAPPLGITASAVLGGYMSYQTQQGWSSMSNAERGFSIAMAALCFLPAAGAASKAIRNVNIGGYRVAGEALGKAEVKAGADMVKTVSKEYGVTAGKQYGAMVKAQVKLLDTYMKLDSLIQEKGLLSKISNAIDREVRGQGGIGKLDKSISDLQIKATIQEMNLKMKAGVVSKTILSKPRPRGSILSKGKFDSPRINTQETPMVKSAAQLSKMTDDELATYSRGRTDFGEVQSGRSIIELMSEDIVRNTRAAAESISGKLDIKSLKAASDRATASLKKAQEKFGADPSKWSDLAYDAAVKQSRYDTAKIGSPAKLLEQHLEIKNAAESGYLKNGQRLSKIECVKLHVVEEILGKRYAEAIFNAGDSKTVEAIYEMIPDGEGGLKKGEVKGYRVPEEMGGRGKGGGRVLDKTRLKTGGGGGVITKTQPGISRITVAVAGSAPSGVALSTRLYDKVIEEVSFPSIKKVEQVKLDDAIRQILAVVALTYIRTATDTDKVTEAGPESRTETKIQEQVEPATKVITSTEVEAIIQDQIDTIAETKIQEQVQSKIAQLTKVAVREMQSWKGEPPKRVKPVPPPSSEVDPKSLGLTAKDLKGANAFKQGFIFWTVLRDGRKIPTTKPIAGVPLASGKGSPQASIVSLGRGIDGSASIDMGISTATLYDPPGKGRPRLTFVKRGPKRINRPRLSR